MNPLHMHAHSHTGVRCTSLSVLGHLILNSMMKVKGNIARLALRLVDEEEEVRGGWTGADRERVVDVDCAAALVP